MMWHQLINIIVHSSNYENKTSEEKLWMLISLCIFTLRYFTPHCGTDHWSWKRTRRTVGKERWTGCSVWIIFEVTVIEICCSLCSASTSKPSEKLYCLVSYQLFNVLHVCWVFPFVIGKSTPALLSGFSWSTLKTVIKPPWNVWKDVGLTTFSCFCWRVEV